MIGFNVLTVSINLSSSILCVFGIYCHLFWCVTKVPEALTVETLVTILQAARCHYPEDYGIDLRRCENLKPHKVTTH